MGDDLFLEAISGENPYGYAALKSLPLRDDNNAPTVADVPAADYELARNLMNQCTAVLNGEHEGNNSFQICMNDSSSVSNYQNDLLSSPGFATTLQEDEMLLQSSADERTFTAIQYRIERKKLLRAARGLLSLYLEGSVET